MSTGLLTIFLPHTSASLLIQENADPDVSVYPESIFAALASHYQHAQEGPDDMPAHICSALTQTHLSIPPIEGRLALGTWQGIYLFEHRDHAHQCCLHLHLAGD
jgi:secondary thiamine-phosphate synthase enzyme